MKKFLFLLIPVALACGGSDGPPGPGITPEPVPTQAPVPCKPTGVVGDSGPVYTGDCEETSECKNSGDEFYFGNCHTRS